MNPIIGLVGPSGSGKSTLIRTLVASHPEELDISKSLTSRAKRGDEDELFYDFTSVEDIRERQRKGQLTHYAEYAGNLYATDRNDLNRILSSKMAIAALVEDGVRSLQKAGYSVIVIKVRPAGYQETADVARKVADQKRAETDLKANFEIINSFEPGGLENSINKLEEILLNVIQSNYAK
jgi:guanylate kinase